MGQPVVRGLLFSRLDRDDRQPRPQHVAHKSSRKKSAQSKKKNILFLFFLILASNFNYFGSTDTNITSCIMLQE